MPNHTANHLIVTAASPYEERFAENIRRLIEEVRGADGEALSFNKISPMPEELQTVCVGGRTIDGVKVSHWIETEAGPEAVSKETQERWAEQYGATDWYEWAHQHWGTKWDCYDIDPEWVVGETEARLSFHTAWAPPEPLIEELSSRYPELMFELLYDDEGGSFFGRSLYLDGCLEEQEELKYTEENREVLELLGRGYRLDPKEDEDEDEEEDEA